MSHFRKYVFELDGGDISPLARKQSELFYIKLDSPDSFGVYLCNDLVGRLFKSAEGFFAFGIKGVSTENYIFEMVDDFFKKTCKESFNGYLVEGDDIQAVMSFFGKYKYMSVNGIEGEFTFDFALYGSLDFMLCELFATRSIRRCHVGFELFGGRKSKIVSSLVNDFNKPDRGFMFFQWPYVSFVADESYDSEIMSLIEGYNFSQRRI